MADLNLIDIPTSERHIGRGAVFYAPEWNGISDLSADLEHLGDTEGDLVFDPQTSYVYLTTPELRGDAKLLAYQSGEDVFVDLPFFVGSPAMMAILSATGSASGGNTRRTPVIRYTLVIVPEEFFYVTGSIPAEYNATLHYALGGTFTKNGAALSAAETRFLGLSLWVPSGHFIKPQSRFRHDEAGKAVETVRFQGLVNESMPNGFQQYIRGNPYTASGGLIEIAGTGEGGEEES